VVYSLVVGDVLFFVQVSFGRWDLESNSFDPTVFEVIRSCVRVEVDQIELARAAFVLVAFVLVAFAQAASVLASGSRFEN